MKYTVTCSAWLFFISLTSVTSKGHRRIHIAGLLPFNKSRLFSFQRVAPALEIAVDKIKLLNMPFKDFSINYGDSKCSISHGMDKAITFFINDEVDVFLGPSCDYTAAPVARQLKYWNIPMVTAGAMARDFFVYKKSQFQLMTRVGPNFNSLVSFITSMLKEFNWRKVKLLYDPSGQEHVVDRFCHIAIDGIHFALRTQKELRIHQEYFKFDTLKEMLLKMDTELGNNFADEMLPGHDPDHTIAPSSHNSADIQYLVSLD